MVGDEEETNAQAPEGSTFPKEARAQQEIIKRRHDGLPIIEESPLVASKKQVSCEKSRGS